MKRIGFAGPFSSGKSTLWENTFKEGCLKNGETARKELENLNVRPQNMTPEQLNNFQANIISKQIQFEEENDSFMQDGTLLDILAYSQDTKDYDKYLKQVTNHFNKNIYDVIFYTPVEFEIENDGLRHIDKDFQKEIDQRIKYNLHITAIKYPDLEIHTITGSIEERVKKVMDILKYN